MGDPRPMRFAIFILSYLVLATVIWWAARSSQD